MSVIVSQFLEYSGDQVHRCAKVRQRGISIPGLHDGGRGLATSIVGGGRKVDSNKELIPEAIPMWALADIQGCTVG